MNSLFWLASLPFWVEGFKELLQITSFYAKSQVIEVHTHEKKILRCLIHTKKVSQAES
jgi:hypothetical protein